MSHDFYLSEIKAGFLLKVVAKPGSKKQLLLLDSEEKFLAVAVKAPPDKGKANKEIVKFLAQTLDLPSSAMSIVHGQTSRDKSLLITCDLSFEVLKERIEKMAKKE